MKNPQAVGSEVGKVAVKAIRENERRAVLRRERNLSLVPENLCGCPCAHIRTYVLAPVRMYEHAPPHNLFSLPHDACR
jgi:hypothetical protein